MFILYDDDDELELAPLLSLCVCSYCVPIAKNFQIQLLYNKHTNLNTITKKKQYSWIDLWFKSENGETEKKVE